VAAEREEDEKDAIEACRLRPIEEVCVDDTVVGRFHDRRLQLLRWILLLLLLLLVTDGEKAATQLPDLDDDDDDDSMVVAAAAMMEETNCCRLLRLLCRCLDLSIVVGMID